ncbi:MAG: histidine kinase [Lachnospiraceae bacterium]|nr:histidine kinase [Lachnospiraceae bacterium]
MRKKKKTLYERLTRPVLILWIMAVLIILTVLKLFENLSFMPALQKLSTDMLDSKSASISWFLNSQANQLYQLGDMLDIKDGKESCLEELRIASQVKNNYESIGLVGRNGMNYLTDGSSFSISSGSAYREILRSGKETIFSAPIVPDNDGERIIIILAKLRRGNEEMEYISASVTLASLKMVLEQSNTFDFCTRIVNDEDNSVLLSVGQKSVQDGEHGEEKARIYNSSIRGWEGMSVELEIPNTFLYSQITALTRGVTVVAIVILLIISALMRRIVTKTTKPVRKLSEAMSGSNLRELPMTPKDTDIQEIAQLTDSYNSMIQNTEKLIHELEQEEMRKKDAEYEALIQQVKPHFLYNTLEMIQSMCLDYEDDRVENAIGLLADFFRSSLSHGRMMIPLKEELHQVESYLKLQQLRFEDKFSYEILDETDGSNLFMRFTLQPIVENAIYHGAKPSSRKENIRIRCVKEEEYLRITVENTCELYDALKIEQLNRLFSENADSNQYPGYGLYNVNCRLKLNYGEKSRLKIEGTEEGVCVTVLHPLISLDAERGE